ncbi:MAG: hypothetical protein KBF82_08075 [Chitinophagaceae bacterium]|nr:hypothetical protein [Chitinophagaceae bacterium]
MATIKQEKISNRVKVVRINLTESYEGTITFETVTRKQFSAFFWGQEFVINNTYQIVFSSLDYPLEWDVIFSENKDQRKIIEPDSGDCSYMAYGQILTIKPLTVDFGDLVMELFELTNDERVIGEFIYWKIERLDVFEVKKIA